MLDGGSGHEIWEPVCFFLTSVGYTMGWTTISSMLSSLKDRFGPAVLLQLNLAYFLPSLPILLLQTRLDARFDRKYGLPQSTAVRMLLGLGGAGLVCLLYPHFNPSLSYILCNTMLLGICCGTAFGSSYQLVSHFDTRCSKALTIGFVGSGPIVLFLEVVDQMGPHPMQSQRILLFTVVAFFTFLGLAASLAVISWNWGRLQSIGADGRAEGGKDEQLTRVMVDSPLGVNTPGVGYPLGSGPFTSTSGQALLRPGRREGSVSSEASEGLGADPGASRQCEGADKLSTWDLLVKIWPAAAALGVNIACVTCLFPFFTYAPSSSGWALLPQVLFFARTISDIIGRFIPHAWLPTSRNGLHFMTLSKLAATPLAFWYITKPTAHNDLLAVVYVSLFWLQSGAVNSIAFVLADRWTTNAAKERGVAAGVGGRSGGVLALVFQASCLVGLGFAYLLQHNIAMFSSDWT